MTVPNHDSQLHRLIYASELKPDIDLNAIQSIRSVSKFNNKRDNVTGALVFKSGFFLQILEGERHTLNATYARIAADERHLNINLIEFASTSSRHFGPWAMRYLSPQENILEKAIGSKEFEPLKWSAQEAFAFLVKFDVLIESFE